MQVFMEEIYKELDQGICLATLQKWAEKENSSWRPCLSMLGRFRRSTEMIFSILYAFKGTGEGSTIF